MVVVDMFKNKIVKKESDTNLGRLAPKPVLYQPGSQLSSSSNGKTSTPNQPVVRNLGISEDATIGDRKPIDKSS